MITDLGLQEVKFTVLSDFYQIFALFRVEKYLKFHSKTQACLISDFLLKFASYQLSVINLVHMLGIVEFVSDYVVFDDLLENH